MPSLNCRLGEACPCDLLAVQDLVLIPEKRAVNQSSSGQPSLGRFRQEMCPLGPPQKLDSLLSRMVESAGTAYDLSRHFRRLLFPGKAVLGQLFKLVSREAACGRPADGGRAVFWPGCFQLHTDMFQPVSIARRIHTRRHVPVGKVIKEVAGAANATIGLVVLPVETVLKRGPVE